jgi:hypothetical protein
MAHNKSSVALLAPVEKEISIGNGVLTTSLLRLRGGGSDDDESGYEADSERNEDSEPDDDSDDRSSSGRRRPRYDPTDHFNSSDADDDRD